ncbi:hypothetical protein LZ554_001905 [Drepanopeziza brunnea f. sp. 'monogermtubi']|nr:hypothetical protein LZ554_001905 [Drepanopeziza brunnea f. sp. 'monogermtubi']
MVKADRRDEVVGVGISFLLLSTIGIALRSYCRICVVKKFGWDDWAALVAWLVYIPFCIIVIDSVRYGVGLRRALIDPPSKIPIGFKYRWFGEIPFVLSNMALRASIAIMLLRIAVHRIHKIIVWTFLIFAEVYGLIFILLFIFQCNPVQYFWGRLKDNGDGKGECLGGDILAIAGYIFSAIYSSTDWVMAIMPVLLMWNVQMNTRVKISVAMVLSLGVVASVASIVRIPYLHTLDDKVEFLHSTVDVALWSVIECGIGIFASALATLRPLFHAALRTQGLSSSYQKTPRNGSGATKDYELGTVTGKGRATVSTNIFAEAAPPGDVEKRNTSNGIFGEQRDKNGQRIQRSNSQEVLFTYGSNDGISVYDRDRGMRRTDIEQVISHV